MWNPQSKNHAKFHQTEKTKQLYHMICHPFFRSAAILFMSFCVDCKSGPFQWVVIVDHHKINTYRKSWYDHVRSFLHIWSVSVSVFNCYRPLKAIFVVKFSNKKQPTALAELVGGGFGIWMEHYTPLYSNSSTFQFIQ